MSFWSQQPLMMGMVGTLFFGNYLQMFVNTDASIVDCNARFASCIKSLKINLVPEGQYSDSEIEYLKLDKSTLRFFESIIPDSNVKMCRPRCISC